MKKDLEPFDWYIFFRAIALKQSGTIFIGISEDEAFISRLIPIIYKYLAESGLNFVLVGKTVQNTLEKMNKLTHAERLKFISNPDPEQYLANLLFDCTNINELDKSDRVGPIALIRGGLSSSKFVAAIKSCIKSIGQSNSNSIDEVLPEKISRLALLETAENYQFFFGGVGIDEINSYENKHDMIILSQKFFERLNQPLKIGLLSGGRLSDKGRDLNVDKSLLETQRLEQTFNKLWKQNLPKISCSISHYEILIENAISDDANLIIAPDGISGNLIYRTLVHLGNGRSYGAVYLNLFLQYNRIVIDCSRVAPSFELEGAVALAAGLFPYLPSSSAR